MGFDDPVPVDEEVEDSIAVDTARVQSSAATRNSSKSDLMVGITASPILIRKLGYMKASWRRRWPLATSFLLATLMLKN